VKFVLFVEGHTERKAVPSFIKRWLDPKLSKAVRVQSVGFDGWSEFQRKIVRSSRIHLNGPGSEEIIGAIGLLDLYGPTFYPDHLSSQKDRHVWATAHFEAKITHPKFKMFFAVHELEAWILSQPQLLPAAVKNGLPGRIEQPESINFNEPPAKLLDRLYRAHTRSGYKKLVDGSTLFSRLDPAVAYSKCPYLARMLDEMLLMAKASGL
jgi:hypothetical protein